MSIVAVEYVDGSLWDAPVDGGQRYADGTTLILFVIDAIAEPVALPLEHGERPVSPGMKAWLDNVLVPAIVKEWLAGGREGKGQWHTQVDA